jgi:hypothetical protein
MLYCPNCSAYQCDQTATACDKCGHVLSAHEIITNEPEIDCPPQQKVEDPAFRIRRPCKRCGSPTKEINGDIDIDVDGERLSIYGLKLMGGEITKRAVTKYTYSMNGYICKEDHKFYSDFKCRIRPLCPVCYDPMIKYGSSLLSCSRCNKHFPVNDWKEPDELDVLVNNGWAPIPE